MASDFLHEGLGLPKRCENGLVLQVRNVLGSVERLVARAGRLFRRVARVDPFENRQATEVFERDLKKTQSPRSRNVSVCAGKLASLRYHNNLLSDDTGLTLALLLSEFGKFPSRSNLSERSLVLV